MVEVVSEVLALVQTQLAFVEGRRVEGRVAERRHVGRLEEGAQVGVSKQFTSANTIFFSYYALRGMGDGTWKASARRKKSFRSSWHFWFCGMYSMVKAFARFVIFKNGV